MTGSTVRIALPYARMARRLHAEGRALAFDDFTRGLFRTSPDLPPRALVGMVPAALRPAAETFLIQRVAQMGFAPPEVRFELMRAFTGCHKGPARPPVPPHVLRALAGQGYAVDAKATANGFRAFAGGILKSGLRRAVRLTVEMAKACARRRRRGGAETVMLMNMHPHTVPQLDFPDGLTRWDFVSWLRRSGLVGPSADIWVQDMNAAIGEEQIAATGLRMAAVPWPFAPGAFGLFRFAIEAGWLSLVAAIGHARGQWWRPLLLADALEAAFVRALGRSRLADIFIFNNTQEALRPLWSYQAEQLGCRVMVVQYSHNQQDAYDLAHPERILLSPTVVGYPWPEIVVWTDHQTRQGPNPQARNARFHVVGPIGFGDSGRWTPPADNRPTVAVFDLVPLRPAQLFRRTKVSGFQWEATVIRFLEDVFQCAEAAGFRIVFKPKSFFGLQPDAPPTTWKRMTAVYRDLIERYGCVLAPYSISPQRVIEATDVCVGFPFTTSASAGYLLGTPAVYYDPTGTLRPFADLGQGCPLITDRDGLARWFTDQAAALRATPRTQAALP